MIWLLASEVAEAFWQEIEHLVRERFGRAER